MKHASIQRTQSILIAWVTVVSTLLFNCDKGPEKIYDFQDIDGKLAQIKYAGLRCSYYGLDYDFTPAQWTTMSHTMAGFFAAKPQPTHVWIIGALMSPGICDLEFENPGTKQYPFISFNPNKNLDHEKMLGLFDAQGIKVYLQVESGRADIDTLIDLVLNQYKHHASVVGFGVDVEWFDTDSTTNTTIPVTDNLARQWEQKIKSHNSGYTLFLKHWETDILPPTYRGDIVFIDDSQEFGSLSAMTDEFGYWANHFAPAAVMFQIGYTGDYAWWKNYSNPPKKLGEEIVMNIKSNEQKIGIVWVDFTLHPTRYPELKDLYASR